MKKTKIFAAALAAVMAVSALPQAAQLPLLSVTAASSKLAAPKNIKATAGKTKITLKWSAVKGADGYYVYKYNSSTKKYEKYKKVTGTSCTVKNLKQGTKYKFKVAAYVKKNGKVVVQTKSKVISATTKAKQAQTNLSDFEITDGVLTKYVGNGGDVVIPDGVTAINRFAFANCDSLTSVTIPEGVTTIGDCAFGQIKSLTTVSIPSSVSYVGDSAFGGTSWIENQTDEYVIVGAGVLIDYNGNGGNVTIPDNVISIAAYAFAFDHSDTLTSVTLPDGVTYIGNGAFHECTALTSINIPNGVTYIGDGAFYNCTALTSIDIPNSVTYIGEGAFEGCNSLKSVTLSNSIPYISARAFMKCTSLTSIEIPNGVTYIGSVAFAGCTSLKDITIPSSIASIYPNSLIGTIWLSEQTDEFVVVGEGVLIKYNGNGGDVTIPDGVITIEGNVFSDCTTLTSITMPDSVAYVSYAFDNCTALKNVKLSSGLIYIYENAFRDCDFFSLNVVYKGKTYNSADIRDLLKAINA